MAIVWIVLAQFVCVQLISGTVVNMALRKPVNVSSRYGNRDPAIAVNGDTRAVYSCCVMHTNIGLPFAWWWVDLQVQVQDATVKIYFRTGYKTRRNGVQLYTSIMPFSSYPEGQLCHTITGRADGTDIPDVVIVNCTGTWRYLLVYTRTNNDGQGAVLDFGEVEVLGCNGTFGVSCDRPCSQCAVTPLACDRYTGACPPGGCKPGWFGDDCSLECTLETNYGANCAKFCSARQCRPTSSSCDHVTGRCTDGCKDGWKGEDCTSECTLGTKYGANCAKFCSARRCRMSSSSCDHVTGQCTDGCQDGWKGEDCTTQCTLGVNYGANCTKFCSTRQCRTPSSSCDRETGRCTDGCQDGWKGKDCTSQCTLETNYGANCEKFCSSRRCRPSSSSCDHVIGQCTGGCQNGWGGVDCTSQCTLAVNYGANCTKFCSTRQCRTPSSSCDRETGRCTDGCQDGWKGVDCTSRCPEGTFGLGCLNCSIRHCKGELTCPGDGTCSGGCQDGWTFDTCTQACASGSYGPSCTSTCGNCTGDRSCDHVTGNCPGDCKPGWRGCQCKESCKANTYGVNCETSCGQCIDTCDVVDGHCPGGCREGYNGTNCQIMLASSGPPNDSIVIPAVIGTSAALLVVIIIVVVFIVYRRRKSSSAKTHMDSSSHSMRAPVGENVYANMAVMQEEAAKKKPHGHEKPIGREKPPVREKPKLILLPKQLQSDPDSEEEILDEVDPSCNRDYYNESADVIRDIPAGELESTVQKIILSKGGFEAEYNKLPTGFTAPYNDSQKPENTGKNKFRGYYPYDHNRVRLANIPDVLGSDYINASLMHSYDQKKTYIAAQAPNKKTVGDFWRMIWEHRCGRVIMLTGLVEATKVKCYQYWQDKGSLETDQFKVEVETSDIRANYTIRHIKVTSKDKGECRTVVQYHYTSWPDHGVPNTLALVNFIWMIRRIETQKEEPLLVHCSAGIGRTGTYIAVDSLLDQARGEGMVDVLGYVSVMRGQRKNMIQTKEQYECVFQCLIEMTKFGDTSMDVETFTTSYSSRGMGSMVDKKSLREITQMTILEERNDPPAKHQMWMDGNQDFIVRVGPSLRNLRGYLQAVTPAPGVVKLLWKLVEERNVNNIFAVSPLQVELVGEKGARKKYGAAALTTTSQTNVTSDLSMMTLQLQMNNEENIHNVNLFKSSRSPTMDIMASLLLHQAHLQHLSVEISPVVLIHSEPDRKSAVTFCIMGNILSEITDDRRVDVIGHVRTFLKCCPDLAFTEQDVEKLFEFAQKCVEMTGTASTYANL